MDQSPSRPESTFGLTDADILEFRDICRSEGIDIADDEAVDAARRVVILYRMLLGRIPEDSPNPSDPATAKTYPLSSFSNGKVD